MGVIYPVKDVANGNIPRIGGGVDQMQALEFYIKNLTDPNAPTYNNVRILMLGSAATGHANRRSDLDRFLLVGLPEGKNSEDLENKRMKQRLHIESVEKSIQDRFHVKLEGRRYRESTVLLAASSIGDPLWISHCVDIQDNPELTKCSYRTPFNDFTLRYIDPFDQCIIMADALGIRNFAIDLNDSISLGDPEVRSRLLQNIMAYDLSKEINFSQAGEFNPDSKIDVARFQRAMELGKAITRKAIGIRALQGYDVSNADVTSKSSMNEEIQWVIQEMDNSQKVFRLLYSLNQIDKDYSSLLEQTIKTGDIDYYSRWLKENYLPACAAAMLISKMFYKYANDYSWNDETITFKGKFMDKSNDSAEDLYENDEDDVDYLNNIKSRNGDDLENEKNMKDEPDPSESILINLTDDALNEIALTPTFNEKISLEEIPDNLLAA